MRALAVVGATMFGLLVLVLFVTPLVYMVVVPSYLGAKDVAVELGVDPLVVHWPRLAPTDWLDRRFVDHYTVTVHAKAPVVVGLTNSAGVERHLSGAAYEELADMQGTGDDDPTQPVWNEHSGHRYEAAADTWSWFAHARGTSAELTIPRTSASNRVVVLADAPVPPVISATLSVRATLRVGGWLSWPLVMLYGWGGGALVLLVYWAVQPAGLGYPYRTRLL